MSVTITTDKPKRDLWPALKHGMAGKCPKCGEGALYRGYLKVADQCPVCREDLSHHRADDAPPYIAIVIVGHLLIGLMLHLEMSWHIPAWTYLAIMVPLAIVLPLAMLPAIKGGVVALQWAHYMHGFDPAGADDRDL